MSYNINGALQGGSITLTRAGGATANISALSGAASTFTIQNVTFSNQGKLYYKATASGAASPVNDASTASAVAGTAATGSAFRLLVAQQAPAGLTTVYGGSACVFMWGLDPSGNVRVAQGRVVPYTDSTAGSTSVPLPTFPDWFTPVAYCVVKLVSATAATWAFGSGLWNATGITIDTPVDLMTATAVDPLTA